MFVRWNIFVRSVSLLRNVYLCTRQRWWCMSLYMERINISQGVIINKCRCIKHFNKVKNIHYYVALDLLRKVYHAKRNCSNISTSKVYDLYCDRKKATERYMIKLPDDSFIADYLSALQETNHEKRKEWLVKFFKLFQKEKVKRKFVDTFADDFWVTKNLVTINKAIWKCEDMALQNSPYAIPLYYILIDKMQSLYEKIYGRTLDFNCDFSSSEQLIQNLEALFGLLDSKKEIDYHDYMISW